MVAGAQQRLNLSAILISPIFFFFFFFFFLCCFSFSVSASSPDHSALLSFKASADIFNSLSSWLYSTDPCSNSSSWLGVICDPTTLRVSKLVLQNLNLTGSILPLTHLTDLRLLSLKHNHLSSSSSALNLSSWPNLKHLYLSHNRFTGEFPSGIPHLRGLRRLDLSYNNFSGEVPMTLLAALPRLLTLRLESNTFTGTLSSYPSACIMDFNVSNNKLSGEIPPWMTRFPPSSFAGNKNLVGKPLPGNCSGDPTEETNLVHSNGRRFKRLTAVTIVVVSILAAFMMASCFVYARKRHLSGTHKTKGGAYKEIYLLGGGGKGRGRGGSGGGGGGVEEEGMVLFEGWKLGFNKAGELLKCSAELLGKGSVGTTYKVVVKGGDPIVVKRVRDRRRRRRKEVDGWLEVIGGLRHCNVVSLRAYYNSAEELLLVYDYLPNGSLHFLLHGNRGPWRTPLDWPTRLFLASGAAKGLAFLHSDKKAKLFHGHLTSSNIIVDQMGNACISDVGLHQLLHTPPPSNNAYNASSQKGDVHSFGVILLEILTGKMVSGEQEIMGLMKWVQSVGREELTGEVFDFELLSNKEMEEEMEALLQVSLLCLAPLPKHRPKMSMVQRMIEDIRTKRMRQGGDNYFMMHDLSSDSSQSTPRTTDS